MANWSEIMDKINNGDPNNSLENLKKQYYSKLKEISGREIICYYSSFLTKSVAGLEVRDQDMTGFMNAAHGLDYSKGLDLILHTPGGDPVAAEHIVNYLRDLFNGDIRVIVPHMAMSAGTMISFAANKIVMGRQSCLGPIDPQFQGLPAVNIINTFSDAKQELATNPETTNYWAIELQKYPSGILKIAESAVELSAILVEDWLKTGMFKNEKDEETRDMLISRIIEEFNDNASSKTHGRHYNKEKCKEFGLKIVDLEEEQELQDAVLSLHHCFTIMLENSNIIKIIENGNSIGYINNHVI